MKKMNRNSLRELIQKEILKSHLKEANEYWGLPGRDPAIPNFQTQETDVQDLGSMNFPELSDGVFIVDVRRGNVDTTAVYEVMGGRPVFMQGDEETAALGRHLYELYTENPEGAKSLLSMMNIRLYSFNGLI